MLTNDYDEASHNRRRSPSGLPSKIAEVSFDAEAIRHGDREEAIRLKSRTREVKIDDDVSVLPTLGLEEDIVPPSSSAVSVQDVEEAPDDESDHVDPKGLILLAVQHFSSTWGDRSAEFAFPLYLVELFGNTLLPASLYGFVTTASGIFFSGLVGGMIDQHTRIAAVRSGIFGQKISAFISYALFLLIFLRYGTVLASGSAVSTTTTVSIWIIFAVLAACGCLLKLATVGISVSVERDWVVCIANGSSRRLTRLNTIMRRIDLICKLVAPLFVSLLTTVASYVFSMYFLAGMTVVTAIFEFIFIRIVYKQFPMLTQPRETQDNNGGSGRLLEEENLHFNLGTENCRLREFGSKVWGWFKVQKSDWRTFITHPIFPSSVAISLLYFNVLSFDTITISYLKNMTDSSDPFIAGMRGVCVVAGLLGTFLMPLMERKMGVVRAGSWSIWFEFISLVPVIVSFYVGAESKDRPGWNLTLLYGGMAISRIGLWAFDLCQLTELQTSLSSHPQRNTLTGLQFALQNIFDLFRYVMTIILYQPAEFSTAASVSFAAVFIGAVCYVFGYARRIRGHLVHMEMLRSLLGKKIL